MENNPVLKKSRYSCKSKSESLQNNQEESIEIIKRLFKILASVIFEYTINDNPSFNPDQFIIKSKDDICTIDLSIYQVCDKLDVMYVALFDFILCDLKDVNFSQLCFCSFSNESDSDFKTLEKYGVHPDYTFIYSIIKKKKNLILGRSSSKDYIYDNELKN